MDKKAGLQMMIAGAMAMTSSPPRKPWGEHRRVGGEARSTATPDKKARRKTGQASRRKNRKK